ncbi:FkbM family methyltransferase [Salibaculum sp.]|uniref:FkbM family methyltransferase n=1 Tax=Salibaculum sp. TaxID=2855480 RepID=UPI002B45FF84|nr:FkbM family methyltransferase [Salibaculum sp.]HKL68135.1 FkbM family methyltransferase [Salibaculum sp.]
MSDDVLVEARRSLFAEVRRLSGLLETEKTRRRAPMVRRLHEIRRMLDRGYHYSSQAGQDLVIDMMMQRKRGGTFLDIGGYDGVTGSNTFFLEVFRGWTGALVEPVPAQLQKAQEVRRCPCHGVAVAASEGEADFIEVVEGYTQMSGLAETDDARVLQTVRADARHKERRISVKTRTLARIMADTGVTAPDLISLDIEGSEIPVLESFDFAKYSVEFWSIENNTGDLALSEIMRANGYRLAEFCGPDELYQRVPE